MNLLVHAYAYRAVIGQLFCLGLVRSVNESIYAFVRINEAE